jgi:type VI secretion system secreted protein VgrG
MSTTTAARPTASAPVTADRIFEIKTELGEQAVTVHRFHCRQELGRLTEVELELLSTKNDLSFDKVLGTNGTVKLELAPGKVRYFNGFITRFSHTGFTVGRFHQYRCSMRTWNWLMTRTADCRIFQNKSVPDIIKEIFKKYPDAKFEEKLSGKYQPREYCVQYRETDFNFVSRLMETEGIYYYFKHEEGKNTMVLSDSASAHEPAMGFEETSFVAGDRSALGGACVTSWDCTREVQSGRYVLTDYDFTKPKADLLASQKLKREHQQAEGEVFDYPGEYLDADHGKQYARTRIEELQWRHEVAHVKATARGLCTGSTFKLKGHPRTDQNREYLILSEDLQGENNILESGASSSAWCEVSLSALSSKEVFRPARLTPHPFVQGPQTAVVVGPSGEEIWTDKYGRVKVQFHWDRYGKRDENSSCWVRVSHPWAGSNWGMVAIPRIGQEVIVDFLEGDPDQPMITGRVYNADQMPPYDLPANATQSGVKSRSSKGGAGANANEIRMEDKKGSEQLLIHAEKNQDIEVENDETHWVGHDRKKTIDNDETTLVKHDRTETVNNNEKITIGVNRTEDVGANETIGIGSNRSVTVGASETKKVALQRTHLVGVNETIGVGAAQEIGIGAFQAIAVGAYQTLNVGAYQTNNIGANQSTTVGANQSNTIGSNQTTNVSADRTISAGGNLSTTVGKDESRSVAGGRTTSVGKDDALTVSKNLTISAGESVTITTGSASISMKKDGTIVIKGKDITIDGSGKINVKAGGDIVMKGSKILQN